MKEIYEQRDAQRILKGAIDEAGSLAKFLNIHEIPYDVSDLLEDEKVLEAVNLRRVQGYERIET